MFWKKTVYIWLNLDTKSTWLRSGNDSVFKQNRTPVSWRQTQPVLIHTDVLAPLDVSCLEALGLHLGAKRW